ncbi:MAG TPA: site-specific integrase [Amycolatopsis sp.]|jgi:integrase
MSVLALADPPTASVADLGAARFLLDRLGVSPSDLLAAESLREDVPTFAGYVPVVAAATPPSSASTWMPYWRVLVEQWGDRRITEPTASELRTLANWVQQRAATRPGNRGGVGAKSTFIAAVRTLYRYAADDKYLAAAQNPAAALRKPRQPRSPRRALSPSQLIQINHVAATTGTDPALDTLLLRLHTETACRRAGALALRPCDLDHEDCTVRLREKSGNTREQPVSRTLLNGLVAHSVHRNPSGGDHDQLLRYRDGRPVTSTHYTALWRRLGRHLPWLKHLGVTAHWIRYTTLTWVERNFGYGLAAGYAGHTVGGNTGSTLTYVPATLGEIATALSALVGEPHPLASHDS